MAIKEVDLRNISIVIACVLVCEINSGSGEASPFFVEYDNGRAELYFSCTRSGGAGPTADSDISVSARQRDGSRVSGVGKNFNCCNPDRLSAPQFLPLLQPLGRS